MPPHFTNEAHRNELLSKGHTSWWLTPDFITKNLISSLMLCNCVYMTSKLHEVISLELFHVLHGTRAKKKSTVVAIVVDTEVY